MIQRSTHQLNGFYKSLGAINNTGFILGGGFLGGGHFLYDMIVREQSGL